MTPDKCPKCGAAAKPWKHQLGQMYECDMWIPKRGEMNQSKECRISELTTKLQAAEAEIGRLREEKERRAAELEAIARDHINQAERF